MSDVFDWDAALDDSANAADDYSVPVPADDYRVKVLEASSTQASTGSPMIKVKMEIAEGQYAGRWLWTNLVAKPDSAGSAKMFARKILGFGLTNEWLSANKPSMAAIAAALVGRQATATVTVKKYKDNDTNDVGAIKAVVGQAGMLPGPSTPGVPNVPQAAPPVVPPLPQQPPAAPPAAPLPTQPIAAATPPPAPAPVAPPVAQPEPPHGMDEEPF